MLWLVVAFDFVVQYTIMIVYLLCTCLCIGFCILSFLQYNANTIYAQVISVYLLLVSNAFYQTSIGQISSHSCPHCDGTMEALKKWDSGCAPWGRVCEGGLPTSLLWRFRGVTTRKFLKMCVQICVIWCILATITTENVQLVF